MRFVLLLILALAVPLASAPGEAATTTKAAPKWVKCKDPKCPDAANKGHEHLEPVKK